MGEPDARGTLGTVRNAVVLLRLLAEGPVYQKLTDLAERSGLTVTTVHRLLRSLTLADLVEQDPKSSRYGLGPEIARLSQRYLARMPILGALAPFMIPLRDRIGRTVQVAILVRGDVVYVDRVDGSDGGLYRDTDRVHPALHTVAGRILAAYGDDDTWQLALDAATPEDRKTAENNRAQWRQSPHLVMSGSEPGMAPEIAVPVLGGTGTTLAALAATPPPAATESQIAEIVAELSRASRAAGKMLSHG